MNEQWFIENLILMTTLCLSLTYTYIPSLSQYVCVTPPPPPFPPSPSLCQSTQKCFEGARKIERLHVRTHAGSRKEKNSLL